MTSLRRGTLRCSCLRHEGPPRLVVLTGGPGAGKTAVLEAVQGSLCPHLATLPESASIVFGGGFPRLPGVPARMAAQRAIGAVQRELEEIVAGYGDVAIALCDRGSLDGLAYWPGTEEEFLRQMGVTREAELARYAAVIHLRVPDPSDYDHRNALRIETAAEAREVDARIEHAWRDHPVRAFVTAMPTFVEKVVRTVELLREQMPPCCRDHFIVGAP
jgi:predicted ATPase